MYVNLVRTLRYLRCTSTRQSTWVQSRYVLHVMTRTQRRYPSEAQRKALRSYVTELHPLLSGHVLIQLLHKCFVFLSKKISYYSNKNVASCVQQLHAGYLSLICAQRCWLSDAFETRERTEGYMATIKRLSSTASDLLSHTLNLTNYEITVSNILQHVISAGCTNLTTTINPSALRFKIVSTQPPSRSILPLLTTLSAQCSVEYCTPHHTTLLRGARVLDKHVHNTSDRQLHTVDVWEMFYSVPVRRRIQQARDPHSYNFV